MIEKRPQISKRVISRVNHLQNIRIIDLWCYNLEIGAVKVVLLTIGIVNIYFLLTGKHPIIKKVKCLILMKY